MKHKIPFSVAPFHQTNWDWRAAGNFIGGGSGTGLLILAAFAGAERYWLLALVGLALVGAGLTCVWAEIGRPLRALNVFRHPQTSWMTREGLVAPFLFASGLAAAWMNGGAVSWLVAAIALGFVYCQARILFASKGIPAWREPRLQPLVIVTGLAEGAGWLALLAPLSGADVRGWLPGALLVLVALRVWLWYGYLGALERGGAPKKTLEVLGAFSRRFVLFGNGVSAALAVMAGLFQSAFVLATAGLLAFAAGWLMKHAIVARAAFNQGFALPKIPVRGVGVPAPGVKPGWTQPAAARPPESSRQDGAKATGSLRNA